MNDMIEDVHVDDRRTRTSGLYEPQEKETSRSHETNCQDGAPVSARFLVFRNRNVCLFLLSFMLARVGGCLTYIATITLIEGQIRNEGTESQSVISVLVASRFLPIVLLSPFGGVLADSRDRRQSMIQLDVLGAACPLLFLGAMKSQTPIVLAYLITALQQSVTGLYEPCRISVTPMLVSCEDELKTVNTLLGLSWGLFGALGSSMGGMIVSRFGLRACFLVDSATYLASAFMLWLMDGKWSPPKAHPESSSSLCATVGGMTVDGINYLLLTQWGPLVFLKASIAIFSGVADVLNVSVSEIYGSSARQNAANLGAIFACIGVGSLVGSLIVNKMTDMNHPSSIQKASIIGLAFAALGCFFMSVFPRMWSVCLFTVVRSVGTTVGWINSSLLLQKFSSPDMLGRVSAIDFALGLLGESLSALICGFLQDAGADVAFLLFLTGVALCAFWSWYHIRCGRDGVFSDGDLGEGGISLSEIPALLSDSESSSDREVALQ